MNWLLAGLVIRSFGPMGRARLPQVIALVGVGTVDRNGIVIAGVVLPMVSAVPVVPDAAAVHPDRAVFRMTRYFTETVATAPFQ